MRRIYFVRSGLAMSNALQKKEIIISTGTSYGLPSLSRKSSAKHNPGREIEACVKLMLPVVVPCQVYQ